MTALTTSRITAAVAVAALVLAAMVALVWPRGAGPVALPDRPTATGAADLLGRLATDAPAGVSGPWRLSLPDDHMAHPDAASETWVVTAHMDDGTGAPLSLLFSLSRLALSEAGAEASPWTLDTAWAGQASLAGPVSRTEERLSRGLGAAGTDNAEGSVWIDDWTLRYQVEADLFQLAARIEGAPLTLTLRPQAAPVAAPGGDTEQAGPTRGFALPRLAVSGRLGPPGDVRALTGAAWLDRLWGTVPGPGGPLVFDRLVAHLDDGSALTLLRSRRRDGRGGETLDALIVSADGVSRTIEEGAVALSDAATETEGWRLTGGGLDLTLRPSGIAEIASGAEPVRHLSLALEGEIDGQTVTGQGSFILSTEAAP